MDADEVKVEPCDGSMSYSATICCDFRPEIISDLRQTLDSLPLHLEKAEISTLAGRMKNVFVFTCCKGNVSIDTEASQAVARTVHQALCSVLEKASASLEFSPRTSHANKRRRLCFIETSTSSCNHGSCLCWCQQFLVLCSLFQVSQSVALVFLIFLRNTSITLHCMLSNVFSSIGWISLSNKWDSLNKMCDIIMKIAFIQYINCVIECIRKCITNFSCSKLDFGFHNSHFGFWIKLHSTFI